MLFLENPEYARNVAEIEGEKCIVMNDNEYFFMGDNWGETTDCMQNGVVHGNNIDGRVDFIVPYGNSQSWAMVFHMIKLVFVPNWA